MGGDVTGSAKEMNLLRTEGALTCQWRPQEIKQRRERWPHGGSGGFPDPSFKHLRQGHGPQTPGRRTCNEHTPSENWWPPQLNPPPPKTIKPQNTLLKRGKNLAQSGLECFIISEKDKYSFVNEKCSLASWLVKP